MGKKSLTKKKRLGVAAKKIRRMPMFVVVRTKRKVSHNRNTRKWRTDKLRIEDEG